MVTKHQLRLTENDCQRKHSQYSVDLPPCIMTWDRSELVSRQRTKQTSDHCNRRRDSKRCIPPMWLTSPWQPLFEHKHQSTKTHMYTLTACEWGLFVNILDRSVHIPCLTYCACNSIVPYKIKSLCKLTRHSSSKLKDPIGSQFLWEAAVNRISIPLERWMTKAENTITHLLTLTLTLPSYSLRE